MFSKQQKSVTLYNYVMSPFGGKVYWALIYKRINFKLVYVSVKNQWQISFSNQKVVPVTVIDDSWKQDSRDTCIWLDDIFSEQRISGETEDERNAIIKADDWVNKNIVALFFRQAIDKEESKSAFRLGRILGAVAYETEGEVPWIARFVWVYILRRVGFVRHAASQLDPDLSCTQHRERILKELEEKLMHTGFIAGTSKPSFADLNAFGEIMKAATFRFPKQLPVEKSNTVMIWLKDIQSRMPEHPSPQLAPNWKFKRWV